MCLFLQLILALRSRAVKVVRTGGCCGTWHRGDLSLVLDCFTSGWPCFRCVWQLFTANILWGE